MEPQYVDIEPMTALVRRGSSTHEGVGQEIGRLFEELANANPDASLTDCPCIFYTDWRASDCDVEAAFPVAPDTVPGAGSELKTYPACTAVSVSVEGPYDHLAEAWMEFMAYIKDNNVDVCGAPWDRYVTLTAQESSATVTELYIPMRNG